MSEIRPVYLNDIIAECVASTSVKLLPKLQARDPLITGIHFEYGHYTDIRERLTQKGKTEGERENRYPLVALFEDYRIDRGTEGLWGISDMKILILHTSKAERTRRQREEEVFRPILIPIYLRFLSELKEHGAFMIMDETRIDHDQINRPHWGDPSLYKNDSYIFNDVLDGIELQNLKLQSYLAIC